ncbi:hypothetical protein HZU75_02620 [Chitinibacter fontanus]|uniref:Uncharacterized protein n=1 Tax=Chitinibacter fontanus TaxID=1737446 RepID=A0A7D5Z4M0_9NEIS|nr:hypothetical protein [Chitinibacter fontanus]QLI80522.1 hypothetical protein HZU75_02620 [Chitinibacter fontanus]
MGKAAGVMFGQGADFKRICPMLLEFCGAGDCLLVIGRGNGVRWFSYKCKD